MLERAMISNIALSSHCWQRGRLNRRAGRLFAVGQVDTLGLAQPAMYRPQLEWVQVVPIAVEGPERPATRRPFGLDWY